MSAFSRRWGAGGDERLLRRAALADEDYLADLGGRETAENVIEGEGWCAVLHKAEPRRIGSLTIGGTSVEFSGDDAALAAMHEKLHWKTLRGGG
jgi:hypothetical protein